MCRLILYDGQAIAQQTMATISCSLHALTYGSTSPKIVITHWGGSWHKDHQNCHLLVRDALFYSDLAAMNRRHPPHTVRKVFFADNWEDADNFKPDTCLDITNVADRWLKACDSYQYWRARPGSSGCNDYYSSLAVMRGCLSGFRHAIALMSDPSGRVNRVRTLL